VLGIRLASVNPLPKPELLLRLSPSALPILFVSARAYWDHAAVASHFSDESRRVSPQLRLAWPDLPDTQEPSCDASNGSRADRSNLDGHRASFLGRLDSLSDAISLRSM
jgi:hypothetical protein